MCLNPVIRELVKQSGEESCEGVHVWEPEHYYYS